MPDSVPGTADQRLRSAGASSPPRVPKLRVAMVGSGRIAVAHLHAIKAAPELSELVVVAGLPEEGRRTTELASRFGASRVSANAEEVFASDDIDAVILAVPNHLHRPLAVRAFEHGKHVLVEKPMATTVEDATAMTAAAAKADRTLMIAQCRRFFNGAKVAKTRMAEIGAPVNIVHMLGVYNDGPKTSWWRSSAATGGLVLGLNGPHVIDTILWLVGSAAKRVFAKTQRFRDIWEGEDQASVIIEFEDGSVATGHLSLNMPQQVNERWIVGPEGMMRLADDRNLWINGEQVVSEEVVPYLDGDSSFDNQFREFAESIAQHRRPLASGEEVVPVVAVMEAARQSALEGRPIDVIKIGDPDTAFAL